MKLLFDTNVVLDVLLARRPFVGESQQLFAAVEEKKIDGYLCATTVTTVFYIAAKAVGASAAKKSLEQLFELFDVAPVDGSVLVKAMQMKSDFEDGVIAASASRVGCHAIITRNAAEFKKTSVTLYSPAEALSLLAEEDD